MKIISWNVNGLRSVARQNFSGWLTQAQPDILCLQEIKVAAADLPDELKNIDGYHSYFNFAAKPGYAGVAVWAKSNPQSVEKIIFDDEQFNNEGRSLLLEFDKFSLLNIYLPHGGRDKSKLTYKLSVYRQLLELVSTYKKKPLVLAGDFNVAHSELDLARPQQNRQNIMFTPEERRSLDELLSKGYLDAFRRLHPEAREYTWWPWIANCRQRNIGWRIDYIFAAKKLESKIKSAQILGEVMGSDHCPIQIDLEKG